MDSAIVFDIGNVILQYDWMIPCRRLEKITGIAADDIFQRIKLDRIMLDFNEGRANGEQFTARVSRILGHEFTPDQLRTTIEDMFWETEGMAELIERLKPEYRLFLLSNTNPWHWEFERKKFPILGEFEHTILSFEVGCSKPSRRIYELALDEAGCIRPVVFFDDIEEYVDAASNAGLEAFQFHSAQQAEEDLRSAGIDI